MTEHAKESELPVSVSVAQELAQELLAIKASQETASPLPPEEDKGLEAETKRTLAERHPDWPPVTLNFYFSSHETVEDFAGVAEHMRQADIYLYEGMRGPGSDNVTQFMQAIADEDPGQLPLDYVSQLVAATTQGRDNLPIEGTKLDAQLQALYGTKVVIGSIDLRPEDIVRGSDIQESFDSSIDISGSLHDTLEDIRNIQHQIVELQEQREKIMVSRFEEELESLMTAHPELKDKPQLRVLATMGSYHTPLFHKARAAGITTERSFPHKSYVYNHDIQAQRAIAFGQEPSEELLAKAYVEFVIHMFWDETEARTAIRSNDDRSRYMRKVASAFSEPEITKLFEAQKAGELDVRVVDELLEAKGLGRLPRTPQELAAAL